jgi:UDP-N-acetylglucosamine 4,6-dehydratase
MHEVLMTREEAERATEIDDYFRIDPDFRNLQYENFVDRGNPRIDKLEEYSSLNAEQMTCDEVQQKLLQVPEVREALKC